MGRLGNGEVITAETGHGDGRAAEGRGPLRPGRSQWRQGPLILSALVRRTSGQFSPDIRRHPQLDH